MLVTDFIKNFTEKKIVNTKINDHAVSDYLKKELEIKTYIPFRKKREIAEMVVKQNTEWVDGIKKNDQINQYISFVIAILSAHTGIEFSDDPVADYDLLAESGLLPQIIAEFQESYSECDIVSKMALSMELEDNNLGAIVGRFLNGISIKIDGISEALKNKVENFDLKDLLGGDFNKEDIVKLFGVLDKIK
jgi:hypothetical protein